MGVFTIRSLLFGVYTRAADVWKLPFVLEVGGPSEACSVNVERRSPSESSFQRLGFETKTGVLYTLVDVHDVETYPEGDTFCGGAGKGGPGRRRH